MSQISRIRGYLVNPDEKQLFRYTGQDPCTSRSLEVIRLTLSDGNEGLAGSSTGWFETPRGALIQKIEDLAPLLLGQDISEKSKLSKNLLSQCSSPVPQAESLLDIAMWDAWGRTAQTSIWQALGGNASSIPAYASTQAYLTIDEYIAVTQAAIDAGYPAIKYHMNCDPDFDIEMVKAIDTEFGHTNMRYMVDLEQRYDLDQAIRLGEHLSRLPYEWMEAPLDDTDLDSYTELNKRVKIDILAAGNTLFGIENWDNALRQKAWSRLRCDANNAGGISSMIDAMALANKHGVSLEFQSFGFSTNQYSNLHIMLGIAGCNWFEHPFAFEPHEYAALNPIRIDKNGLAFAPEGHGLGLDVNWEKIESNAKSSFDIHQ